MNEVLLNGKEVDFSVVDPAKHKFIGMFRYPYPILMNKRNEYQNLHPSEYVMHSCPRCGVLDTHTQSMFDCWQMGHFDIPQFANIEEERGSCVFWSDAGCLYGVADCPHRNPTYIGYCSLLGYKND